MSNKIAINDGDSDKEKWKNYVKKKCNLATMQIQILICGNIFFSSISFVNNFCSKVNYQYIKSKFDNWN